MTWTQTSKYAPLIPWRCEENPDYSIHGEWTLCKDGVMRVLYRAYYRHFPIHEIESSTNLVYIKYAIEDYMEEAAFCGDGVLVH